MQQQNDFVRTSAQWLEACGKCLGELDVLDRDVRSWATRGGRKRYNSIRTAHSAFQALKIAHDERKCHERAHDA